MREDPLTWVVLGHWHDASGEWHTDERGTGDCVLGIPSSQPRPQTQRPAAEQHSDFIYAKLPLTEVSALSSPEHHHCLLQYLEKTGHDTPLLWSPKGPSWS